MRPFDLEAAKRGEPIEAIFSADSWEFVHFIGVRLDGSVVFENHRGGRFYNYPENKIRMAEKPAENFIYLAKDLNGRYHLVDSLRPSNMMIVGRITFDFRQ